MVYYEVEKFGAEGDGFTNDSEAIQKAIDNCCENGGGIVVLQSGKTYYTNSIQLKKNVELHLQKGSILKATSDINGYIRPCNTINDPKTALIGNPVTGKPSFAFIYAYEADNCTISGEGKIDANGHSFVERKSQYYVTGNFYPRPTVMYFEKCNHVSFKDFTVCDASFWTLHPAGCEDVLISQIHILNDLDVANGDGIDPDHCKNVRIVNCHIQCADDCIALKNSKGNAEYGTCENIIISGCTLTSTSAAIKIGTEGIDDFKNIIVDNCIISRSNRGISLQIRDNGSVENVSFSNIMIETRRFSEEWWGSAEPISITCYKRDNNTKAGSVHNVRFFNITCKGENGVLIHGTPESEISDITFNNLNVTMDKTSKWPCGIYDLRPSVDYEIQKTGNSAIYIRNASDITFEKTEVHWGRKVPDYEYALDAEHVNNLKLVDFEGTASKKQLPALHLVDVFAKQK